MNWVQSIKFRAIECALEHFRAASAQEARWIAFFHVQFSLHDLLCKLRLACERQKKWESAWNERLSASREKKEKHIACALELYATCRPPPTSFHLKWNKFKLRLLCATVRSGNKFFRAMCRSLHPVESEGPFKVGPLVFERQTHIDSLNS